MNLHEIEKNRRALLHAGTLADKKQLCATLILRLKHAIEHLQHAKAAVQEDYRHKLERWRTQDIPENVAVCALPSDMHDSRLYRVTGVFALLCEMALAAWVFAALGVPWWLGVLMALGVTFTLHGIFLHVFDNRERPKESIHRIKNFASLPAVFGFLVALALVVLARYVYGPLAVMLLPVFSLALWLGTLSLLILAASLFTVAHIQGWSAPYEDHYQNLAEEERMTSAFLDEVRAADGASAPMAPVDILPPGSQSGTTNSAGLLVGGIVAVVLLLNAGCSRTVSASAAAEPPNAPGASVQVFVDTSGSCVRPALQEAWSTLRRELPDLIENRGINTLTIWQFDVDGWSPRRVAEIALPARTLPLRKQAASTEWANFANFRDAMREADEQQWRSESETAHKHYRENLAVALKPLEAAQVLPQAEHETRGTDVVGLLRRISQTNEREAQYVIILTDLADTQYRVFPKVPVPHSELHVLVMLVPAQAKDAKMTLGKEFPGPEQFDIRSRQLHKSAPWIAVAPYFTDNLAELLGARSTE